MKLPNFFQFEPLNRLKEQMGIPRDQYGELEVVVDSGRLSEVELLKLASSAGLEIPLADLKVLADGTLAYKNSRVLLYIRDVNNYGNRVDNPRFHLANCSTLQKMKEMQRFELKYVVSTNTDGLFELNVTGFGAKRTIQQPLDVCKNCLSMIGFKGYSSRWSDIKRQNAVKTFRLLEFFELYPRSLHSKTPKFNSDNAPANDYALDWDDISARAKERAGYICQDPDCRKDLSAVPSRRFLHVHHRNGFKADNSYQNLEVLCLGCHAERPMHQHMKSLPDYAEFMRIVAR